MISKSMCRAEVFLSKFLLQCGGSSLEVRMLYSAKESASCLYSSMTKCCILQKECASCVYSILQERTHDGRFPSFTIFSIGGRNLFSHTEIDDKSSQNSPAASVMVPGYEDDYVIIGSCSPSPIAICLLRNFKICLLHNLPISSCAIVHAQRCVHDVRTVLLAFL